MKLKYILGIIFTMMMIGIQSIDAQSIQYENGYYYGYDDEGQLYQNQFVTIDNEYYYFKEDGKALTSSWKKINGQYYYFGNEGKALKGVHYLGVQWFGFSQEGLRLRGYHEIDQKRYFFNSMGASVRALFDHDGHTIFLYGNGNYAKNRFFRKSNHRYVFDQNGYIVKNQLYDASHIQKRDTYYVYCDEEGIIQEGLISYLGNLYFMDVDAEKGYKEGFQESNGHLYYFQEDGKALTSQWLELNDHQYYFDENGHAYQNQIVELDSNMYYFDENGWMATGYLRLEWNNDIYYFYFDENGTSLEGLYTLPNSNSTRYFNGDGTIKRSEFVEVDEQIYFLTKDGIVCKNNWRNIGTLDLNTSSFYIHCDENGVIQQGPMYITRDGSTAFYYMDLESEKGFRTGIQEVDGKQYGFSLSSGKALKGVKVLGEELYYFQDDYSLYKNGWITIGNKHYYFREDGRGYMEQLVTMNDNPYYFTSSGYVATGYRNVTIDTQKYYFFYDENGISQKGLIAVPNTTYSRYFNGDGSVLTSQFYEIDDQLYFFTNSGILFIGNWRNAGRYDLNLDYDLYIHSDENGIIAQGYSEFIRDGKEVVYYFDRFVEFGHRLGLVDCGEQGTYYFLKSKTYGSVAKGFYSDPTTKKTYAFDEESGKLQTSGSLHIAGTSITYPVLSDGTLDFQPCEAKDERSRFIQLCINELYKKYTHYSFSYMENKTLEEIDGYSCSGFVIRLLYELYDHNDYFERNHDLMYQAYCNRENGQNIQIWSKYYPREQLKAGDFVVINKYDCYEDVDDVGDLSIIDLNEDGICDREHEPFLSNDNQLISLHVHHIGIYLGDGYYINSIPSRGVCIQKIPEDSETMEVSAYARVLP